MLFGKLDLPDEVWQAAIGGRLVVFAGAGVSMGEPSNLPSFDGLAEQVASGLGTKFRRSKGEPADEFLGRLVDSKVPVHPRAAKLLSAPESKPSEVHESLVHLFREPGAVRIVTTNFDLHFERVAAERWSKDALEVYSAPALPVGSDFRGIVHLHGSLAGPAERLVVTDADFSRAYLTEGWARRFLRELTEDYVVLFTCFSFGDVPSKYLLRGLPAGKVKQLVALVPVEEKQRIPSVVRCVRFSRQDNFLELREGLREFAAFASMDDAQHRKSLLERVLSGPPAPGPETDYLSWALSDPVQARYLAQAEELASLPWLEWVSEHGLLESVFKGEGVPSQTQQELIWWYCKLAFTDSTWKRCLEILAAHRGTLTPFAKDALETELWKRVAALRLAGTPLSERERFWLAVVTGCSQVSRDHRPLGYLLGELPANESRAYVELWSELAHPALSMAPGIRWPGDDRDLPLVRVELELGIDHHWIRKAWSGAKANAAELAPSLLPVLLFQIGRAHRLLRLAGQASERFDPESFRRASIAPHPQDRELPGGAFLVVIDAARDCLEALGDSDGELGRAWAEAFLASDAPLAQRLGIFQYSRTALRAPDEALDRVVAERWLEIQGAKPEVFAVLRAAYRGASEGAKTRLLGAMAPVPVTEEEEPDEVSRQRWQDSREYEWFNLLNWLADADPTDALVVARLEEARAKKPEFQPREHPELDHWMGEGGVVQAVSPFEDDEARGWSPEELVEKLTSLPQSRDRSEFLIDRRQGYLEQVGRLAASDLDWAFSRAAGLPRDEGPGRALASAMLEALSRFELTGPEVCRLVDWYSQQQWLGPHVVEVARSLEKALSRVAADLDEPDRENALELVRVLWESAPPLEGVEEDPSDWLHVAINHPQGSLGLCVLHLASAWRKSEGAGALALPENLAGVMRKMLAADPATHPLARVVLASQFHFLLASDAEFARAEVLPWFSWEEKGEFAIQAWDGFLSWGRVYRSLLPILLPKLQEAFEHLGALGERRRKFGELVALCALVSEASPLEGGWLQKYFTAATDEDRERFTKWIAGELEELEPQLAVDKWKSWLQAWVGQRLAAPYPPRGEGELEAFYELAIALPSVLTTEAVEMLKGYPLPPNDGLLHVLHLLEEKARELSHATLLALLILLFTNPPKYCYISPEGRALFVERLRESTDDEGKERLRALLVRAGLADFADQF